MPEINGTFDDKFDQVADAFSRCFSEYGDVGASVCITVEGETVVDLWGGHTDAAQEKPWGEHSLGIVWSATKGVVAIAVLRLVELDLLDLDVPIATYWPEYAQNGKEEITLRQVLTHTAGVPFLDAELPPGSVTNWDAVVQACELQRPEWAPGSTLGYHAVTFGWILGEVIRRVSGMTVGSYIAREIAGPLGAEFYLGLPEANHSLVAEWAAPAPDISDNSEDDGEKPAKPPFQRAVEAAYMGVDGILKSPEFMSAEVPAVNGYSNGRGLATIFRPLALRGEFDGTSIVGRDLLDMAIEPQVEGFDSVLEMDAGRRANGFKLMWPNMGPNYGKRVFGHGGFGGHVACADPDRRLSFGYVMNKPWDGDRGTDPRAHSLITAAYDCIG